MKIEKKKKIFCVVTCEKVDFERYPLKIQTAISHWNQHTRSTRTKWHTVGQWNNKRESLITSFLCFKKGTIIKKKLQRGGGMLIPLKKTPPLLLFGLHIIFFVVLYISNLKKNTHRETASIAFAHNKQTTKQKRKNPPWESLFRRMSCFYFLLFWFQPSERTIFFFKSFRGVT